MRRIGLLIAPLLLGPLSPLAAQRAFGSDSRSSGRYDETFRKYSKRFFGVGYEWQVFKAQAMAESELNPNARSQVGARGLMQLMPSTFHQIQSGNPELQSIDDPEWNIAAGIQYDRFLWQLWKEQETELDRRSFMFGSYNAGRGTILRAQAVARRDSLDHRKWASIERIAPQVRSWRHRETLGYIRKINGNVQALAAGQLPERSPEIFTADLWKRRPRHGQRYE